MRNATRLTSAGVALGLLFATPMAPALADDDRGSLRVESATLVDLNGDPIEAQDAGVPAGDGGNAPGPETAPEPEQEPEESTSRLSGRLAIEQAHALGSKDAQDMRGFEPSLYRGKWYMPKKESIRRCIMDREAGHRYTAISAGGVYRGAYQMNRALAVGASWMMQKEVKKEMGPEALEAVKRLREIPTHKWNRYWQDRAFWTIWRKGKGKHHWRGGAWKC